MDINLRFCLNLMHSVMLDLTARELKHFKTHAGILRQNSFGGTYHVVEWPKMDKDGGTYLWEGQSDNRYHAKAEAIGDWLKLHAPAVRARHLEKGFPEETPRPGTVKDKHAHMPTAGNAEVCAHPGCGFLSGNAIHSRKRKRG